MVKTTKEIQNIKNIVECGHKKIKKTQKTRNIWKDLTDKI